MDVLKNLKDIKNSLKDYFQISPSAPLAPLGLSQSPSQLPQLPQQSQQSHQTTIINYVPIPHVQYVPTPQIINYISPAPAPAPIIIQHNPSIKKRRNEEDDDDEKNKKNNKITNGQIIAGTSAIGVIALATTYFLTQDEYVKYNLSQIDTKINDFKKRLKETMNTDMTIEPLTKSFVENYENWQIMFLNRVESKFNAKIIGSGSLASGVGGFILCSTPFLFVGLVGTFSCGCYMLWKHMTKNTRTENEYYEKMNEDLEKLILYYENKQPSAPSLPLHQSKPFDNKLSGDRDNLPPAYNEVCE